MTCIIFVYWHAFNECIYNKCNCYEIQKIAKMVKKKLKYLVVELIIYIFFNRYEILYFNELFINLIIHKL